MNIGCLSAEAGTIIHDLGIDFPRGMIDERHGP
jgi:hypothetical protein